jgi:protein TonB
VIESATHPRALGAAMCAAYARTPGQGRRRLGVVMSMLAHVGVLTLMAWLSGFEMTAATPQPAPVLVHLAQPRARAAPKTPSQTAPVRRPRPAALVQPPAVAEPQPTPSEPEEDVADESVAISDDAPAAPVPAVGSVGGQGSEALELREVARRPTVLQQVTPEYPALARWRRLEGVVVVRVILSATGLVEPDSVKVTKSVPALDPAAIAAIKRWRFSPAIGHGGQPVRVIIEVPFDFSLH